MIDKAQQRAICHVRGPCLAIAGPGAGKTYTLVRRIAYLTESCRIPPSQLLVITFTKAAAKEMQRRYREAVPPEFSGVAFGTFHSIFFHMLRETEHLSFQSILDSGTKQHILKTASIRAGIDYRRIGDYFNSLAGEISFIKNTGVLPEEYEPSVLTQEEFVRVYAEYERMKEDLEKVDFDDMLTQTKRILVKRPEVLERYRKRFSYFLVDEAQDMNAVQYEILQMLAGPQDNLFLVGDDDQAIYAFRGAEPKLFLGFTKDYPQAKTIVLQKNYRCDREIVRKAQQLIRHNRVRFDKELVAESRSDGKIRYLSFADAREEAAQLAKRIAEEKRRHPARTVAVLYRNHLQNRFLSDELEAAGLSGSGKQTVLAWHDKPLIRTVMDYLAAAGNHPRRDVLLRILNKPQRYLPRKGLEDETVDWEKWLAFYGSQPDIQEIIRGFIRDMATVASLPSFAAVQYVLHKIGLLAYAKECGEYDEEALSELFLLAKQLPDKRRLSEEWKALQKEAVKQQNAQPDEAVTVHFHTFHGAKGLEFDHVYILDVNEGITPARQAVRPEQTEEERRMFYVAMTRAKHELSLSAISRQGSEKLYPSRFLKELAEAYDSASTNSSNTSDTMDASSSDSMLSRTGVPSDVSK